MVSPRLSYHGPMRYLPRPTHPLRATFAATNQRHAASSRWRAFGVRCLPVVLFFAIAFVLDRLTQQRYSAVFGSAAIVASVLSVIPAVRPAAVALGTYGGIWVGFNLVRAGADDAGVALGSRSAVAGFETAMFGGTLPSQWLQEHWHDSAHTQLHDVLLAVVHASFFVMPFVVAGVLWFRYRTVFGRYCWATAIAFGLGAIGFLLLPTAPPWMSDPETVSRVTMRALAIGDGGSAVGGFRIEDSRLGFEPNHVAAMPSVHVAAAVLVGLAMRAVAPRLTVVGIGYALAMSLAVVYLGEHFVVDAVAGWGIALLGWVLAPKMVSRFRRS